MMRLEEPCRRQLSVNQTRRRYYDKYLAERNLPYPSKAVPVLWDTSGPSVTDLREAWRRIAERHNVLRWRFPFQNGAPIAIEEPEPRLEEVDVRAEDSAALKAAVSDCVARPLDAGDGVPVRMLVARSPKQTVMGFIVEHLLVDGIGARLLREALEHELRDLRGEGSVSPETPQDPPDMFTRFVIHQNSTLSGRNLERLVVFWNSFLRAHPVFPGLDIGCERARETATYESALVTRALAITTAELRDLCRVTRCPPMAVFTGAFLIALSLIGNRPTVGLVGAWANRSRQFQSAIGWMSHLTAYAAVVLPHSAIGDVLRDVSRVVVTVFEHAQFPLQELFRFRDAGMHYRTPYFGQPYLFFDITPSSQSRDPNSMPAYDVEIQQTGANGLSAHVCLQDPLLLRLRYRIDVIPHYVATEILRLAAEAVSSFVSQQRTPVSALAN